jgi:hypothetical protein
MMANFICNLNLKCCGIFFFLNKNSHSTVVCMQIATFAILWIPIFVYYIMNMPTR